MSVLEDVLALKRMFFFFLVCMFNGVGSEPQLGKRGGGEGGLGGCLLVGKHVLALFFPTDNLKKENKAPPKLIMDLGCSPSGCNPH